MPHCPLCKKSLPQLQRACPRCQADLSLLVDLTTQVRAAMDSAERHTREGELAEAIWSYLAVLELDPDNPQALRQVGMVAAAVRHFDRARSAHHTWRRASMRVLAILVLVALVFLLGYGWGQS